MRNLVFVYGTLKKGYGNHRLLEGCECLGEAITVEDVFFMHDNGSFPYVLRHGTFHVKGEVYVVTDERTMQRLDWLEGAPTHYKRIDTQALVNGGVVNCEIYVASDQTTDYVKKGLPQVRPNDDNVLVWER